MAQVVVEVNGRSYTMQCADGEEDHLAALAGVLDREVSQLRGQVGAVGDIRLLLMGGLMVADKLTEAERRIEALKDQIEGLRQSRSSALDHQGRLEAELALRLEQASERLEALAAALSG